MAPPAYALELTDYNQIIIYRDCLMRSKPIWSKPNSWNNRMQIYNYVVGKTILTHSLALSYHWRFSAKSDLFYIAKSRNFSSFYVRKSLFFAFTDNNIIM